jgi:DNA repair protein RadD
VTVSDTYSAQHLADLEALGIGPNRAPPRLRKRYRAEPPIISLFARTEPALAPENLTPLYPYQQTALDRLNAAIDAAMGRIIVQAPTGAGKTVLAAHIIAQRGKRGLVTAFMVPQLTLIDQTVERFKQYGITSIGVIQARHRLTNPNAALQVCSIQTLDARRKGGGRALDNIGLVIVDEAHVRHDEVYRLMDENPDVVFVGLSATPWSNGLGKHWRELIICETIAGLIEHGKENPKEGLVTFVTYAPGKTPDLSKVKSNIEGNDYDTGALGKVMNDADLIGDIVKTWKQKGRG